VGGSKAIGARATRRAAPRQPCATREEKVRRRTGARCRQGAKACSSHDGQHTHCRPLRLRARRAGTSPSGRCAAAMPPELPATKSGRGLATLDCAWPRAAVEPAGLCRHLHRHPVEILVGYASGRVQTEASHSTLLAGIPVQNHSASGVGARNHDKIPWPSRRMRKWPTSCPSTSFVTAASRNSSFGMSFAVR